MLGIIIAAALCVPSVHMTKTAFLECVKPYPDEYWVARQRGVPHRIEQAGSQATWIYVKINGWEDKYTFGPAGRLQSQPKKTPNPQPTPVKAISP